ncbi:MAG: sigma-70 family RNA polymerase sigma factor [Candidatus Eremiobacteraeota bacterium]|nr:sigma-70 family RNA polymerase sigma factor [Candidatus Eremiobacteraeota bacterium]MBV9407633.1 sigma-70 family RNA polymerase sigma factor [Candidatus Eremiobacteraeota bacterium]
MLQFHDALTAEWACGYDLACRIVLDRETALDVTQEAMCRALRHERTYDAERPLRPWFLTIVRNVALNELRRPHCTYELFDRAAPGTTLDQVVEREECAAVLRAFDGLRPAHRRALQLKSRGYQYHEIARDLGIPIGTAQAFVHRARLKLRAVAVRDSSQGRASGVSRAGRRGSR